VRQDTRQRILAIAEELLLSRGFQGFSYHHISERLGVRNAAVHYHFPSKNDLGLALIQRQREHFRWWGRQLREQRASPAACLEHFFAVERRFVDSGRVCPLGVTTVELLGVSDPMRAEAQLLLDDAIEWLAAVLEVGRRAEAFRFRGLAQERAVALLATMQGALQLARLAGEHVFEQILAQVRHELGMPPNAATGQRRVIG
jgi:TetR/AcrR family transcriptional regulator, transcriptional repressor for nem operon